MKIGVIIGTRPTFIELAPVIYELKKRNCELLIYHTGQHYDKDMSDIFLKQLSIPPPTSHFQNAGDSHAEQTARMLTGIEAAVQKDKPDLVIVEGDTNTALAGAMAVSKLNIPVIHIEAGCRSFDKTLPEEINRVIISHVASLHFAPTKNCMNNLLHEGIDSSAILLEGHPIVDSINIMREKLHEITYFCGRDIKPHDYYYVTIHRDFNADDPTRLEYILGELDKVAKKRQVVFPIHPRTKKRILKFHLLKYLRDMITLTPVDYVASLSFIQNAYAIITDSGGLTKEGCIFGVPCITLRPNTEWVETLDGYSNQLAFSKGNTIMSCIENLDRNYDMAKQKIRSLRDIFGDVGVSANIAEVISHCNPRALILTQIN